SLACLLLLWSPSAPGSGMSALADLSGAEVLATPKVRKDGLAVPEPRSAQALSAESRGGACAAGVTMVSPASDGTGCAAVVTVDGAGCCVAGAGCAAAAAGMGGKAAVRAGP